MEELSSIKNELSGIISTVLKINRNDVTDEANFINELGADSMSAIDIICAIEEHYGITIPDERKEELVSVKNTAPIVCDLISKKK